MKKIYALIISISISSIGLLAPIYPAQADLVCEEGECEFVFEKTEQAEIWPVPAGVSEIEFEVYGGQGGANGGLGGFVSGTLKNLPSELTVVVGGAGLRGAGSPGGFNGGGESGTVHANPGSGGGASDIRIGAELSDRIVVAGGGGGFGGPTGGDGAPGGGEIAADGSAGQGGSGAGGSQLAGGAGGLSNGAETNGSAGVFGIGGNGGSGQIAAGGAGGGGGYYGGGGGGADIDPCCIDAGGGGGGSSFADPLYTQDVSFQPGTQYGDGKIIFRYSLPPSITNLSYLQLSPSEAEVSISFDRPITGIGINDFEISGCEQAELSGAAAEFKVMLAGCGDTNSFSILPNSMGENLNTPTTRQDLEIRLDQLAPVVSFVHPATSNTNFFTIVIETDETGIFKSEAVSSDQCQIKTNEEKNLLRVDVSECPEGEAVVSFGSDLLRDSIGNRSLEQTRNVTVLIDTVAPFLKLEDTQIEEVEVGDLKRVKTTTEVGFSEPLAGPPSFSFTGSDECTNSSELIDGGIILQTLGCPEGAISWTSPKEKILDLVGNTGPAEEFSIVIEIPKLTLQEDDTVSSPVPSETVIPNPTPPIPVIPTPVIEPIPVPPIENEAPLDNQQPEQTQEDLEPAPIRTQESVITDTSETSGSSIKEPQKVDQREDNAVENELPVELEEQTPEVASPATQLTKNNEKSDQVSPLAIIFASLLVLALIIAVILLTKNNRSRTIE